MYGVIIEKRHFRGQGDDCVRVVGYLMRCCLQRAVHAFQLGPNLVLAADVRIRQRAGALPIALHPAIVGVYANYVSVGANFSYLLVAVHDGDREIVEVWVMPIVGGFVRSPGPCIMACPVRFYMRQTREEMLRCRALDGERGREHQFWYADGLG